jgi:hypothetical protein
MKQCSCGRSINPDGRLQDCLLINEFRVFTRSARITHMVTRQIQPANSRKLAFYARGAVLRSAADPKRRFIIDCAIQATLSGARMGHGHGGRAQCRSCRASRWPRSMARDRREAVGPLPLGAMRRCLPRSGRNRSGYEASLGRSPGHGKRRRTPGTKQSFIASKACCCWRLRLMRKPRPRPASSTRWRSHTRKGRDCSNCVPRWR